MGSTLRMWLRSRQLAARLAQADAEALIRDLGGEAYYEARRRERDVVLPDGTRIKAGHPLTGGSLRS